jgi:glycine dehydrogenase subunit 2
MSHGGPTIFERSVPGRRAAPPFEVDVPQRALDELLPAHLRRRAPAALPEVTEGDIAARYSCLVEKEP